VQVKGTFQESDTSRLSNLEKNINASKVIVNYIVAKDGTISDVLSENDLDTGCDNN
jgi:hypothetical protein